MGRSKNSAPKGPPWDKLLAQTDKYMEQNEALFREYMDFQRGAYDEQRETQDKILDIQLPAMEDEAALAQQMRDRYREMGIPFEESYIDKLTTWDSEARREERAGEAQAQIGTAAEAARMAAQRRLEGYGIDPSQTRSAAMDASLRLQEAVQKAGAGNQQRRMVEQEGLQLGAEALNLYRGLPAMSTQALQNATGAGQTSLGNQQAVAGMMGSTFLSGANMLSQGQQTANQGWNTANNIYGNQLAAHEMNQRYGLGAGLGQLAGVGIGAAGAIGSGGMTLPGFFGFAEGGPGDKGGAAKTMAEPAPVNSGIPADNIPAMLSKDEYVLPPDVVRWEGEKSLQNMINKARKDRRETETQRAANQRAMGIPA